MERPQEAEEYEEAGEYDEAYEDEEMFEGEDEEMFDEDEEEEEEGFQYTPQTVWLYANEEYEPNPDDEDVVAKCLTPLELCNNAFVLRNYCTNRQAREEYAKYKKAMDEEANLKPPPEPKPEPKPVEWAADDLYGSVVGPKGPTGPNPLEVDPTLSEREKEPIVLTPEEEYLYGPMEPARPPPIPKPDPPKFVSPSVEKSVKDDKLTNTTATMSNVPQRPRGSLVFPTLSTEEDWAGHPMEDPAIMYFYEEDFRLIPGDVIVYTKPRLARQQPNQPPTLACLISIYEDCYYYEDHGQFRQNFLDHYPLEAGDLVVRFGNFNKWWLWNRHPTINFYMYWPGLRPPLGSDKKILHPWYWIDHGLVQYKGPIGPTLPISLPVAEAHMPIGVRVPDFQLRNGDVLIHHDRTSNFAPPFDHKLECHVWNPLLTAIGQFNQ
ncbi:unnamed protein product [Calypogeia fissa]